MFDVPKPIPFDQQIKQQHAGQANMSREQVKEQLTQSSEAVVDVDELIEKSRAIQHNWVQRGLKVSCEGAGHPNHQVWRRLPK